MRLIFVRHGFPNYQLDCLTELGGRQAALVAERLRREPIIAVYSSPYGRAMQTARPTAENFGLPILPLPFMHEVSWSPIAENEETKENPQLYHPWLAAQRLAREGINLNTLEYTDMELWKNSTLKDSYSYVAAQSDLWLETLGYKREGSSYLCTRENADTIALFAHHGSGICFFSHLLGVPLFSLFGGTKYNFTGITILDFSGNVGDYVLPVVETFNEHSHLEDNETILSQS